VGVSSGCAEDGVPVGIGDGVLVDLVALPTTRGVVVAVDDESFLGDVQLLHGLQTKKNSASIANATITP